MCICPHCGKPGITAWEKALITPRSPAQCRLCKGKVNVRTSHYYLSGLPYLLILVISAVFPFLPLNLSLLWFAVVYSLALFGAGLFAAVAVYALRVYFVPLERR